MSRRSAPDFVAGAAAAVTVLLTAAAFWLSYEHLHDVAHDNGLRHSPARAWAWPATIDLFILVGELLMLNSARRGRGVDWWAVGLTAMGSIGSIALNVAGVGEGADPLEYIVAAVPPTAALIAFGALMRQVHDRLAAVEEPTVPVSLPPVPAPTTALEYTPAAVGAAPSTPEYVPPAEPVHSGEPSPVYPALEADRTPDAPAVARPVLAPGPVVSLTKSAAPEAERPEPAPVPAPPPADVLARFRDVEAMLRRDPEPAERVHSARATRTRAEVHAPYVPEPEAAAVPRSEPATEGAAVLPAPESGGVPEPEPPSDVDDEHEEYPVPDVLLPRVQQEFDDVLKDGRTPSVRQLRQTYSIGQKRAQLIKQQLAVTSA